MSEVTFHLPEQPKVYKYTTTLAMGNCPFRGLVRVKGENVHVKLDDRCPETVPTIQVRSRHTHRRFDDEDTSKVVSWVGEPPVVVPVLVAGEYCHTCVFDVIRERELGLDAKSYSADTERTNRFSHRVNKKKAAKKILKAMQTGAARGGT